MSESFPLSAGEILHGKYRIEEVIGQGAMGTVVAAWHLGLDQRVAIKMLHGHVLDADKSVRARFQREARAAAKIHSEHVCRVLDTGELKDGSPFLVMEFMEGADLEAELATRGRFTVGEAAQAVFQACDALKKAHAAGIVHRDLKPANLFLAKRPDGSSLVKILDFGVSKSLTGTSAGVESATAGLKLTGTAMMIGSPIYMSPEQLNSSKDVDGRTDIWALGAILYELTTGETPFSGESMPQLVSAVIHQAPTPLAKHGVEAPEGFEALVMRALCKDRENRIAGAGDLAKALIPFCRTHPGFRSGMVPSVIPEDGSRRPAGKPQNDQSTFGKSIATRATMPSMPAKHDSFASAAGKAGADRKRWFVVAAVAAIAAAVGLTLAWRTQPSASSTVAASAAPAHSPTATELAAPALDLPAQAAIDAPADTPVQNGNPMEAAAEVPEGAVSPTALAPDDSPEASDPSPNAAVMPSPDTLKPELTGLEIEAANALAPTAKQERNPKTSARPRRAARKKKRATRMQPNAKKSVSATPSPASPTMGSDVPNFGGRR